MRKLNPYTKAVLSGGATAAAMLGTALEMMDPITPGKVSAAVLAAFAAGLLAALGTWAVPNASEPPADDRP